MRSMQFDWTAAVAITLAAGTSPASSCCSGEASRKTWAGEDKPLGRAGLPADTANAALRLASSESSWVTGQALVVDGGLALVAKYPSN
jgi:NAD(P)-dependent dehydrogenase (short-subunit alcohol dehydrogenase family)